MNNSSRINKKTTNAVLLSNKYSSQVPELETISKKNGISISPRQTTNVERMLTNINVYKVLEKTGISMESQ